MDLKWTISEEERTRHDALFYSQKPQDRYLSGEQARSLFIRSKLPLPELSKIWKLADVTRNNKLDLSEFAVAMHLIQSRLKGTDIPLKLPETLTPNHVPHVSIPVMSAEEKAAYERAFRWKNNDKTGYIDAETACAVLTGSGIPEEVLARIWNLSDIDRDGKLSLEEFLVALHLTRFCKQGNSIEGSVNARSILSHQLAEECYDSKKLRLAEVQTEKRKLLSVKEKLCHEIAGDLEEEAMAQKIQEELDQVERQVYVLEKEENELRRALQQLKDKSKRESFKPFDRSFLLKRQPTGEDIFRGAYKKYRAPLSDKVDEETLKLWREDGDLNDFGASISEEHLTPTSPTNIRQDQFGRTVIELSENHQPSGSNSSKSSSGSTSPVSNGVNNDLDEDRSHSFYSNNNEDELNVNRTGISETRNEGQVQEGDKEVEKKALDYADKDNKSHLLTNGSSSNITHPTINGDSPSESTQPIELDSNLIAHSSSDKAEMNENRTDDEKTGELQIPTQNGPTYTTNSEKDALQYDAVEIKNKPAAQDSLNNSPIPVEEAINVVTAPTAESSAASRMDGLFLRLEEDDENLARNTDDTQISNRGGTSPRSLTQDELIPFVMEEKKRKDEERAKQRELDDEMRRKAREELNKQDEENKRIAEGRKAKFVEERQKLEKQTALAQEKQEPKKAPLSRTEAGRMIEEELEKQRIREELTRIEIEKIKEKEKFEMEKQKSKHAKKEEHPSAFHNKELVQKPIFDEKKDFLDGGDIQGTRISSKRGSVIDLSEGDVSVRNEVKKMPVENRPVQEPVYTQPQLQRQPHAQSQPQPQPVIRRGKESGKVAVSRKAENRKSFVELDIERQKEREEEARREAEIARRIRAKKQTDSNSKDVEVKREESKTKEDRPATNGVSEKTPAVEKQPELETVVRQTNKAIVESPPVDQIDAKQRSENGAENGESQIRKAEEEEERRKREEEKERFRQMQEEERKRREAHNADLERIRKEVDRKEAEEMMRVKLAKEEEKKKQREAERRKAEERDKDNVERQKGLEKEKESRKTAFAAHKLILEQRVLKALEESKQENTVPRRRASSFESPTEGFDLDEPIPKAAEGNEEFASGGVKLRKANFENAAARKDSKEELRKKRYSLNLEQSRRPVTSPEDASSRSKYPGSVGKKERASHYADDVFDKGTRAQMEREEDLLRRVGWKTHSNEGKLSKAKSLGDLSLKKGQNNDQSIRPVLRRVSLNRGDTDVVDGFPSFSDSRIQKELEEQRMREEVVKKEITEREKRHRHEEEKKKAVEIASGKKETSLNEIKRNPLPNKIQVKKPTSNRDSLTHSMAAHWENMLQSQEGHETKDKKERKKSRIEMEKEEERRREEELQKERERVKLEIKKKEEANKSEQQRKMEEEMEKKRQATEEKEKRQQRTSAMKSLFEKMGGKK